MTAKSSAASIALNRFGLGARPDSVMPSSPKKALLDEFARFEVRPPAIAAAPDTAAVSGALAQYFQEQRVLYQQEAAAAKAARLAAGDTGKPTASTGVSTANMQLRQGINRATQADYSGLVGARMTQALVTDTPFVERMVHFWANHFAVSIDKLPIIGLAGTMEMDAIRPHVLGTFSQMLNAVERHPAMLLYLDQAVSIGPDSVLGARVSKRAGKHPGLNENLGREIMELHTLGVRSGYSQADVTEFARALTGWTVAGVSQGPASQFLGTTYQPGQFVFVPALHEPGSRTIMGKAYAQTGEAQGQAVLDTLASHPATAKHLATKLARHFAGDTPPPKMVARLEAAYLKSGGDLPTVYRAIIESPEAWTASLVKFRNPWEWTVATMRATGQTTVQPQQTVGLLNQLGQPTWKPESPAGYDDIDASWAGPDAVMRRVEAARRMAARVKAGTASVDARQLAAKLFPASVSPSTAQTLASAESPMQAVALLLVAPEMMRR